MEGDPMGFMEDAKKNIAEAAENTADAIQD